jgi:fumarylacetoacetase
VPLVRDIQALEMRPMGPLTSKNVGTSMSPWVITPDALETFVTRSPPRQVPVVSYLDDPDEKTYSVAMNVTLTPKGCSQTTLLGQSNIGSLYWSVRQMIAHIASAGSPLRTGDLMATGTISGSEPSMACCLSESTDGGRRHLSLEGGGTRIYLEDGDFVRMTAVAGSEASGVGFGECVGELLPARPFERTSSYQGSQQGG